MYRLEILFISRFQNWFFFKQLPLEKYKFIFLEKKKTKKLTSKSFKYFINDIIVKF